MKLTNLRNGIMGLIIAIMIIILFNQNIQTLISSTETEFQVILYLAWVSFGFLAGAYAPIGTTIEDAPQ